MALSKEAKLYLKTFLEYAEWFDGFQEALVDAFEVGDSDEELEKHCEVCNKCSAEIWDLLKD